MVDFISCGAKHNEIEYFYPQDRTKYRNLFERIYKIWSEKKPELYSDMRIHSSLKYIDTNCFRMDFSLRKAAE